MRYRQCLKCLNLCAIIDSRCSCGYKFQTRSDHKEHIKMKSKDGAGWSGSSEKELVNLKKRGWE